VHRYPPGVRPLALSLCALCAAALCACGDTLQNRPVPDSVLEALIATPYPVYWAGSSFQGLSISDAAQDPSGAVSVQYGNCLQGGQSTCVAPLRIVTSPDNSFLPGGAAPHSITSIRGAPALVAQGGRTLVIPTGQVVLDIYASNPTLARAAARTVVPINAVGSPEAPLPPRLPDSGFAHRPLSFQTPSRLGAQP
jgi:hypothetical protein